MDTLVLNADDSRARRVARTIELRDAGFEVIEAGTPAETVRAAAEHEPGVALLAISPPDFDGLEVGRQLRAASPSMVIVHLCEQPTPEIHIASLETVGADLCLPFAVHHRVLAAQIRSLLRLGGHTRTGAMAASAVQSGADPGAPIPHLEVRNKVLDLRSRIELVERGSRIGTFDWNLRTGEVAWAAPAESGLFLSAYATWDALIHPEDREHARAEFAAAAASGGDLDLRFRVRGQDGRPRWIHALGAMLRGAEGDTPRMVGIILDATAEMDADERFRTLAEAIPHMVWVARENGVLEYANGRMLAFAGLRPDQVGSLDYRAYVHPEDCTGALKRLGAALRSGEQYEAECRLRRSEGGPYRWHLVRAVPVPSPSGAFERWFGTCTDIEEDMRVREALRRIEHRFRLLWDSSVVGMITADRALVHEANDAFLQLTGFTRDDMSAGRLLWGELVTPACRDATGRALDQALARGWCDAFELEILRKDGRRVAVLIGVTLLEREPTRFLGLMLDLTRNKELEKKLIDRQKLETVGVLAGGVAHGFNNLLTGIMGNTTLAREALPAGSREHILLGEVIRCAESAADLTRQMLAYSGKGRFFLQAVDLSDLVRDRATLLEALIPHHVALRLNLDPHLPTLVADAGQMQQVLVNLIINALEAIGDRIGAIHIRISQVFLDEERLGRDFTACDLVPGNYVCLEVLDTGSGMDAATRDRIFEPFYSTKFQGRGLGLAAVAGIVRGHRGAIVVESEPGRGSTFRVFLPVTE